jgi:hypothetical protein
LKKTSKSGQGFEPRTSRMKKTGRRARISRGHGARRLVTTFLAIYRSRRILFYRYGYFDQVMISIFVGMIDNNCLKVELCRGRCSCGVFSRLESQCLVVRVSGVAPSRS